MPIYPLTIRRCQHVKVNGIQCGSPAKRNEKFCFFHEECRVLSRNVNLQFKDYGIITLPTLEDANSIQLGLGEVMRLLVTQQIEHRTASLLLTALRTAAANVKFTCLEPPPTHIVVDPRTVEYRPLGATAWSHQEGRDYDALDNPPPTEPAAVGDATPDPDTIAPPDQNIYRNPEEIPGIEKEKAFMEEVDRHLKIITGDPNIVYTEEDPRGGCRLPSE